MDSVESTVRACFEALNRSNVDEVVALFTEDATLLVDEAPTATGRAQIRGVFEGPSWRPAFSASFISTRAARNRTSPSR
ncbi:MAG: nuclear transport factor 2 family protein [Chloroflexota bacterium]|nr:nuclear transport factor 2 family protein [Chloroflexota bacterium]